MELDEAREIAQYVIPRLLCELPYEIKILLVRPGKNEDSMLSYFVEKAASDIRWKAIALKNQRREQYI